MKPVDKMWPWFSQLTDKEVRSVMAYLYGYLVDSEDFAKGLEAARVELLRRERFRPGPNDLMKASSVS